MAAIESVLERIRRETEATFAEIDALSAGLNVATRPSARRVLVLSGAFNRAPT